MVRLVLMEKLHCKPRQFVCKPWRPNWLQGKAAIENGMLTSSEAIVSSSAFMAWYCWVSPKKEVKKCN